ncbi:MAG: hypothetical protein R2824_27165 [Saprospiraceae bacterium]
MSLLTVSNEFPEDEKATALSESSPGKAGSTLPARLSNFIDPSAAITATVLLFEQM